MTLSSAVFIGGLLAMVVVGSVAFIQDPNNAQTPYRPRDLTSSASLTNPSTNLELMVSLNATSIRPVEAVNVTIREFNTLGRSNNVSRSSSWPLGSYGQSFGIGPCGSLNDPMGIAVFRGYFVASNVSSAKSLDLYAIEPYFCPVILPVTSYYFAPLSSSADIQGACVPLGCLTTTVSASVNVSGFWESSNVVGGTFHDLPPGTYTVAAGDEWGSLLLLHFVVG